MSEQPFKAFRDMTPEEQAEHRRVRKEREDLLRRNLKAGDVLMHLRCGGLVEEHRFTHWCGPTLAWIAGTATADTRRYSQFASNKVDDIAPMNVVYVNRQNVETLDFYAAMNAKETANSDDTLTAL